MISGPQIDATRTIIDAIITVKDGLERDKEMLFLLLLVVYLAKRINEINKLRYPVLHH